jgi:hypothetical protein
LECCERKKCLKSDNSTKIGLRSEATAKADKILNLK